MPFRDLRVWALVADFPGPRERALRDVAAAVLPAALGRIGTDRVAGEFAAWVRGYRPGADMEHGYGFPRLRQTAASPAPRYLEQLERLEQTGLKVEEELKSVNNLPAAPNGQNVIADLMAFFFHSSEANDLCYRAAIHRDVCRSLRGSEKAPEAIK
jgi:hypothetical protein